MWYQLQQLAAFVETLLYRIQSLETRVSALEQQVAQIWADQNQG